ncbi:MAG: zinc ribbon domain-containing protein [Treponema sp.]|jgi:putative FmdB family regulatory protein|nr:zinc ribbon domain-containing protein [Treponema sp.]
MPTYEYECKSCRHSFEVFQSMKDEPLKICPECGKEIRRLITGGSGVIFKGSGFYITDAQTKPAAVGGAKDAAKNDVANGATADKAGAVGGDKSSASNETQKRKPVAGGGDASGAVEKKEAS